MSYQGFDLIINATSASHHGQDLSLPAPLLEKKTFCWQTSYKQKRGYSFVNLARKRL